MMERVLAGAVLLALFVLGVVIGIWERHDDA
jgi:hypothetical protein